MTPTFLLQPSLGQPGINPGWDWLERTLCRTLQNTYYFPLWSSYWWWSHWIFNFKPWTCNWGGPQQISHSPEEHRRYNLNLIASECDLLCLPHHPMLTPHPFSFCPTIFLSRSISYWHERVKISCGLTGTVLLSYDWMSAGLFMRFMFLLRGPSLVIRHFSDTDIDTFLPPRDEWRGAGHDDDWSGFLFPVPRVLSRVCQISFGNLSHSDQHQLRHETQIFMSDEWSLGLKRDGNDETFSLPP